jgi:hypothetical protein
MRLALLVLLVIALPSCNQKKPTESLITNGYYKYWLVVRDTSEKSKAQNLYYFDKNGKWLVFQRGFSKKIFSKLDRGDVYFIETWKLINESTVEIGTRPYHIEKITENEFVFLFKKDGYKRKLIAAPDSIIPLQYRKMQ